MPTYDSGILRYLERIKQVTAELPIAKNIDEQRWITEQKHSTWKKPAPADIEVLNWWVTLKGREIPIRIYRHKKVIGLAPIILYFHGGGFVASSFETHDTITWGIADETPAAVISVNYRRAPENPYPAAVEDCYDVLNWVIKNSEWLKLDPTRIIVAGDSAGGCLATVLAAMTLKNQGPQLLMQALLYPCVDTSFERSSMLSGNDPMLNVKMMKDFWKMYLSDRLDTQDPYAVPMRSPSLAGLPPAYVVVGEHDPLRDETHEYAQRLTKDNVPTDFHVVPGVVHGFLRARFVSELAASEFSRMCSSFCQALSR